MTIPMTRRDALVLIAGIAGSALLGCSPERSGVEEIVAGADECAWCRMLIDDVSLAAQFVPGGARRTPFGEVGCMLAWLHARPDVAGVAWVRARESGQWVEAQRARFGIGETRTPMRFDIVAHDLPRAGTVTWESLQTQGAPDVRTN